MRASRIPHPPGSRFVALYEWIVRDVGKTAAAIVAVVDFLDRREDEAGRPVASRARIVADLEGFIGRNAIDVELPRLVARGWLRRHERTEVGQRNLQTFVSFSLDASAIAAHLAALRSGPETPELPKSETPELPESDAPELPESGPESDLIPGVPSGEQEEKKKQQHGRAARPDLPAAFFAGRKRKGDEGVLHGVEVWTSTDVTGLQKLVEVHGAVRVEEIAATLRPAEGHQAPYLSAVLAAVEAAVRANEAGKRFETEEQLASPERYVSGLNIANALTGRRTSPRH